MQQLVDNRYRLVRPLGSGGMADVYLAHDSILDRDVALKVMSARYASDDEFIERFKREAQSAAALSHANTGSILGTAHYISPEQAMGEPVGPASDLYSLGVVLYEMLTGELPYDAETPLGIAMKHVNGHLQPPKTLNPQVPDGINAITLRLLAKNPEDRYASDSELIEDLERVCAGLDPSGTTTEMMPHAVAATTRLNPPSPPQRIGRNKVRRRRAAPPLLALLALLVLAALTWGGDILLQERQAAQIGGPELGGM